MLVRGTNFVTNRDGTLFEKVEDKIRGCAIYTPTATIYS